MSQKHEFFIADASPEDASGLAFMHAKSLRDTYFREGDEMRNEKVDVDAKSLVSQERIERRLQLILRALANSDEEIYLCAKASSNVVGLLYGTKSSERQELVALYIDKNYHGRGIGRALVERFFTWCDTSRPIELGVIDDNVHAQGFYEHMGFKIVADSAHPFEPNPVMTEITMIREPEEERI